MTGSASVAPGWSTATSCRTAGADGSSPPTSASPAGATSPTRCTYHRIRFQLIFCARGWVDLVYEDQGPPFRLEAGDCVVQPPEIRHRVLHASEGLEVIEIGCPAVHDTFIEHELALPTPTVDDARSFGGQRFVRDVAASRHVGSRGCSTASGRATTGVAGATDGLAGVRVIQAARPRQRRARWLAPSRRRVPVRRRAARCCGARRRRRHGRTHGAPRRA